MTRLDLNAVIAVWKIHYLVLISYGKTHPEPVSRQQKLGLEVNYTHHHHIIDYSLIFHEDKVEGTVEKCVDEISEAEVEYEQVRDSSHSPVMCKYKSDDKCLLLLHD